MQRPNVWLAVAALLAVTLSGCSIPGTGGKPAGFSMNAGAAGEPYVFTASDAADNYTWDMGDHLTILHGKKVEHTYDFTNGNITVTLITKSGDEREQWQKSITLGTGVNAPATFFLEAETNWTVVGETFRVSGASSTDPDGDAPRFSWNCIRTADAIRKGIHTHPGAPNFGTPSAGTVTSRILNAVLPAADRVESGDFCDALSGSRASTDAIIEGKFARSGIYDIYMLAADCCHPSTSGKVTIYVTDPEDRPDPVFTKTIEAPFQAGSGGTLQGPLGEVAPDETFDRYVENFFLPLASTGGYANLTYDTNNGVNVISFCIMKGDLDLGLCGGGDEANNIVIPDGKLAHSTSYSVVLELERGADVKGILELTIPLNMDPGLVF